MAIADTITSMQNHTSNAYTMIGYGTDLTGINKNLENLSTSIFNAFLEALRTPDTLFTNLPKKSASGSNISLTGVANAPMRITLSPSELTQASTPTPSSPQEVHTISGDNKVVVCGKNLFDYSKVRVRTIYSYATTNLFSAGADNTTVSIDNNNTLSGTASPYIAIAIPFKFEANKTIYNNAYTGERSLLVYDNSGNVVAQISAPTISYTPSTSFNGYLGLGIKSGTNTAGLKVMFSYENNATFEPYISQEAEIYLGGENLFNINTIRWEFLNDSNGNVNANTSWRCTPFESNLKKNTTYTLSWKSSSSYFQANIVYYDANKTYISSTSLTRAGYYNNSFTTPSSFKYYKIAYAVSVSGNDAPREEIMLNEGSTVLPYKEYIEPINYSKISTYEDKFIRTSGKNLFDNSKIEIGKSWHGGSNSNRARFYIELPAGTEYSIRVDDFTNLNEVAIVESTSITSSVNTAKYTLTKTSAFTMTHTFDSSAIYLCIQFESANTFTQAMADNIKLMLNLGSTPLPYEPYGNGTWYIKKNIGKVVLDTLTFDTATSSTTGYVRFRTTSLANLIAKVGSSSERLPMLSNCYVSLSGDNNYNRTQSICAVASGNVYIYDTDYAQDTLTNFMTHLTTTGAYLYYPLATPTYTQITGTLETQLENVYQKLLSYSGTTNISQVNNDLPFIMNVSAIEV